MLHAPCPLLLTPRPLSFASLPPDIPATMPSPMSDSAFILIVEDDAEHAQSMLEGLRRMGHVCRVVETGPEAVESVKTRPPDVLISDYKLTGPMNGLEVLQAVKKLSPATEVILITAYGDEQLVRSVLRRDGLGAYDYLTKPLDLDELRDTVSRAARLAHALRDSQALRDKLAESTFTFEGMIASSPAMARVIRMAKKVADSKITVLIEGESGTGKDLLARAIHAHSARRNKTFQAVNCAGFNEGTLESELFGHVRGAFTGAERDRKGIFEYCDGGSLFLDEVGDMPKPMQAKLLRVLGSGEITPVGSNESRTVDVRLIAATHRDLSKMVAEGTFREDLFYRVREVVLKIPPLRERREDIPPLVEHFIDLSNQAHAKSVQGITSEAMRRLMGADWRGNVRQLQSTLSSMVVLADKPVLDLSDLPEDLRPTTEIVPAGSASAPPFVGVPLHVLEKEAIRRTLDLVGGNREKAAKLLQIPARTLYRRLKDYQLE